MTPIQNLSMQVPAPTAAGAAARAAALGRSAGDADEEGPGTAGEQVRHPGAGMVASAVFCVLHTPQLSAADWLTANRAPRETLQQYRCSKQIFEGLLDAAVCLLRRPQCQLPLASRRLHRARLRPTLLRTPMLPVWQPSKTQLSMPPLRLLPTQLTMTGRIRRCILTSFTG